MTRLRFGILSTARIGLRRLIPAMAASPRASVFAIASRERRKAEEVAGRFDIPRVHANYDALLDDPDVDAVYIPLPNSLHKEWTLRAIAAGKHVLCEKPLALDEAEARAMADAAAQRGVLLQEAFMYRFHPQVDRLLGLVRGGAIGRPWLVRAAFSFTVQSESDIRLAQSLGGGGLYDVGAYTVSISRLLLGEPLWAEATAVYERGVDVRLAGLLGFPHGTAAVIDCGLRAQMRQSCEVVGTEGAITLPRPFLPGEDPAYLRLRHDADGREETIEISGANHYTIMVDHFVDCVLSEITPRYPIEDAVANMRALDWLAASAAGRRKEP